ncbi:MAG TPA: hypothetical protein PKW49_03330 [Paludibacteraceae bacterium]|nr:hypothetical protein [Paludibacteraceae bacterium]
MRSSIAVEADNADVPAVGVTQQEQARAGEVLNTCAAPHVFYNKEKKQWQTPDGRLFDNLKKAERHLNTI